MGATQSKPIIDGLGYSPSFAFNGASEKSKLKVEQLIRANNHNYGFLFNNRKFHNHCPHHLVSAFFLGATPEQLTAIFEKEANDLTPWSDENDSELLDSDWKTFLGNRNYEHEFFNFFSDKVNDSRRGWKPVARHFLNDEGLVRGLMGGLVHPAIHLGYAVEVDSPEIAIEALAMICTEYLEIGSNVPTKSEQYITNDPYEIIDRIRNDDTLNGKLSENVSLSTSENLKRFNAHVTQYTNELEFNDDVKLMLDKFLHLATGIFAATYKDNEEPVFDFFLLHLLTGTHSLAEILLTPGEKLISQQHTQALLRDLWIIYIVLYISGLRPLVKLERITKIEITSVEAAWNETINLALTGPHRFDSHYVKAIRALLFAQEFTQDNTGYYARAALNFARHHNEYARRNSKGKYKST